MKKRISILLMLLLVMAAVLSGCGKEDKITIKEPVLAKELKTMFDRRTASFTREELEGVYELTLEFQEVANLQELEYLKNLQLLDISCNYDLDFSALKELVSLEYLYVTNVPVISLNELSSLGNVKVLSLNNTRTTSLEGLEYFPEIQELYITGSVVTDASSYMETLNKLRMYGIEMQEEDKKANDISFLDAGVEEAVRMTVNNITQPLTQEQMDQVEVLVLMDEKIASLEDLVQCKNLKSLMLWNTQVTDVSKLLEISSLTEVIIYSDKKTNYTVLSDSKQIKRLCINGQWIKDAE